MSQLSSGGLDVRTPNLRPLALQRIGTVEVLQAPGVVPAARPANTQLAQGLLGTLQDISGVLQTAAAFKEQEQAINKQQETAERALAARHARKQIEIYRDAVNKGEMIPEEDEDVADFVSRIVKRDTEGFSAGYSTEYAEHVEPQLLNFLFRKAEQERLRIAQDSRQLAIDRGLLLSSPQGMLENFNASKNLPGLERLNDNERMGEIIVPLLGVAVQRSAAAQNNTQFNEAKIFLDSITSVLGSNYGQEQEMAANAFAANRARLNSILMSDDIARFSHAAANGVLDVKLFDLFNKNNPGVLTDEQIRSVKINNLLGIDRRAEEQIKIRKEQEVEWAKQQVFLNASQLMNAARETGGAAAIGDVNLVVNGKEINISRNEQVRQVTDNTMRIMEQTMEDPFPAQEPWLAINGVTYPRWERTFASVYSVTSSFFAESQEARQRITREKVKVEDLPENVLTGFDLFRRLKAVNPRLAYMHIRNPEIEQFYDMADLAFQYITPGERSESLLVAANAVNRLRSPAKSAFTVSPAQVVEAIGDDSFVFDSWMPFDEQSAKNSSDMQAKVANLATLYVAGSGIDKETAIQAAIEKLKSTHTVINGWAVQTNNVIIPENFEQTADGIIKDYVSRHGEEEGISESDLALIPGDSQGTWVLVNANMYGVPVEHIQDGGFFTNTQLWQWEEARKKKKEQEGMGRHDIMQRTQRLNPFAPSK